MGEVMVVGVKLTSTKDNALVKNIQTCGLSNSDLLRSALYQYFNKVNHFQQEDKTENNAEVNQEVNQLHIEKDAPLVNQIDASEKSLDSNYYMHEKMSSLSIIQNHEFIEHLKQENEWLKNRVEFYEHLLKQNYHEHKNHLSNASKEKINLVSRIRW